MSAAPSYIVYGHRHGVRLVTRLLAVGLLLAAIVTVLAVRLGNAIPGSHRWPRRAPMAAAPSRSPRSHHARTGTKSTAKPAKPTAKPPPAKPKSHKPAKPIPPTGKIPVMVLNSNGIHGVAHQLAAKVQSAGYPITYVGNAQKRGLPTIVQYAKGYGPAARKLARLVGNVQFVTPFDGITPSQAKGAKLVVILGT